MINLLVPKAEPTALRGRWILPLWKLTRGRSPFMVLILVHMRDASRYTLKKVIKFAREN